MADWNAYRRTCMIEGLKEARAIAIDLHAKAVGHKDDVGQRRMASRIEQAIDIRILALEEEGRQSVYAHYMGDPAIFDDAEGRN